MRSATKTFRTTPRQVRSSWISVANLWFIGCLALTAMACGWVATRPAPRNSAPLLAMTTTAAGEQTIAPVDERIELAQVGTAAWSHNPTGEEDLEFGESVDPATWKHLVLRSYKSDGSACDINLLRPNWWIEEEAAEKGGTVYVSVPECGIDGDAEVLAINPCPPIQKCPPGYRTITGTFHHRNAKIIDLYIEGLDEPIGTTPNHPFWSVDTREFVPAGRLHIGERLASLNGAVAIARIVDHPNRQSVYNLEIHRDHVFCVGPLGILVHNAKNKCEFLQRFGNEIEAIEALRTQQLHVRAGHNTVKRVALPGVIDPRKLGGTKQYSHQMTIVVEKGTIDWLKTVSDHKAIPGHDLDTTFAIPQKLLDEFNRRVKKIEVTAR